MIAIARVVAPQGVAGELRVQLLTDFPERFRPPLSVTVDGNGGMRRLSVTAFRPHRAGGVITLAGVASRDEAAALVGATLLVGDDERWPAPKGRYYVDDLIGLTVVDLAGESVGTCTDVVPNPAHDLIEVDRGRLFVPVHHEWIEVDVGERVIRLLRTLGADDVAD